MSHKVIFLNRDGSMGSQTFPTLRVASVYARGVKGGCVVPGGTDETFTITVCGTPEEEEAKRARAREALNIERAAEASFEAGVEVVLQGGTSSEALDAANAASANVENMCACGKRCNKGMTACYSCMRYR
jgi:hypothetical protein